MDQRSGKSTAPNLRAWGRKGTWTGFRSLSKTGWLSPVDTISTPTGFRVATATRARLENCTTSQPVVELDVELKLAPISRKDPAWRIWGRQQDDPERITSPHGKWLLLRQGWVGSLWNDPTDRLHVVLCPEQPTIAALDMNQVYGAWVEGHGFMRHASSS